MIAATIGILRRPHSIAGNVGVLFGPLASDAITIGDYLRSQLLSTVGNAIGGVIFVALLEYHHVTRGAD
ncbi:MAG: hypothetical protein ACLFMX_00375 [Halobacteriales archaeon]